MKLMHG